MKDNKATLIVLLFLMACTGLVAGVYYLRENLARLQTEYDDLEQRIVNAQAMIESLTAQKRVFTEVLSKLEDDSYHAKPARDGTEFYTAIHQTANNKDVEILSTQQQGDSMTLSLQGKYYNVLQVLADWRNLPITVRVANLSLQRTGELDHIMANMTVETVTGGRR